jgi:hypothetical protein
MQSWFRLWWRCWTAPEFNRWLDQNMSVLEGSLGILPRRVLVAENHELKARRLLKDAGLGHELRPDGS